MREPGEDLDRNLLRFAMDEMEGTVSGSSASNPILDPRSARQYKAKLLRLARALRRRHARYGETLGQSIDVARIGPFVDNLMEHGMSGADQIDAAARQDVGSTLLELRPLLEIPYEIEIDSTPATGDPEERPRSSRARHTSDEEQSRVVGISGEEMLRRIRQDVELVAEQYHLVRLTLAAQREALLEMIARAKQKPDFAVPQSWAKRFPELFPSQGSWDTEWYAGEDPQPTPGTQGTPLRDEDA